MTMRLCVCGRAMPSNWSACSRCRGEVPAPAVPPRDLTRCTVCGEAFANRGLLAIHVRSAHGDPEED